MVRQWSATPVSTGSNPVCASLISLKSFLQAFFQIYAPVRIGDTITATATVKEIIPERNRVVMETVCRNQDDVVVTTGEAVLLLPKESVDK